MREFKKKSKAQASSDSILQQANESKKDFFGVQAKLEMGKPGDKFEKEADAVADQVVNRTQGGENIQQKGEQEEEVQKKPISETISRVQKKDMEEEQVQSKKEKLEEEPVQKSEKEEEDAPIQTNTEKPTSKNQEEKEDIVQSKSNSQSQYGRNVSLSNQLDKSKGKGRPLDVATQNEMENGFATDFSQVRIHTGQEAEQMNQGIGAQAFTHGNDIYFNHEKYHPNNTEGKHLLAHELTHTIQQKGAQPQNIQRKIKITGTDQDTRDKFLKKINKGVSDKFKLTGNNQLEPEDENAKGKDTFSKKMLGAIKAAQNVELRLITENDRVFVDSFKSGKVDTADMLGLSDSIFKSLLVHFVVERFAMNDYEADKSTASNTDFKKAHKKGHEAQEAFLKELYPNKTIKYKSEGFDQSSKKVDKKNNGTIDYIFHFTDVKYVFTQPIKNGNILENITKAEIKVIN